MTGAHQLLAGLSGWLWPALLDHLWQGTLFAGVAWFFCLFAKRASSKTRYAVWLMASLKFATPTIFFAWLLAPLDIEVPWPRAVVSSSSVRVVAQFPLTTEPEEQAVVVGPLEPNRPRTETTHTELYCSLTLVWVLGSLFFLGVWRHRHSAMKTRLRKAEPLISGSALETLYRLKTLLQVRRPVTLILSSDFPEPGVCGIWRPKLVLPKRVVEALTDQELEAVLTHELAHVRRRDNLVNLFQAWLGCVLWFHPVIWLINRQLLVEREGVCDEEVLSRTPNCQDYLSSLLKVFRSSLGEKLAGASLITGSNLKRRIDHMRSHGRRKNSVIRHRLSVSVFVLAWIASVAGTALVNQKVVVAQQNLESAELASNSLNEEHPTAALHGVRSGVGVAAGILGGVKGEAPKRLSRSEKQTSEPPLGPPSSGPGTGDGIGTGTGGGVGPGRGGGVGPGEGGGIGGGVAVNQSPPTSAQHAGSAKLFGTVSDASQARVPDATVVVSAKEGGIMEITISNAAGEYELRALPLGRHTIEVRMPGFRSFQQAFELHANEPRKLDAILEVGEVSQTINVIAKAPPAAPPDTRSGPPHRIRVGGNIQQMKLVHQVKPIYPERAQAQGIQGIVLMEAVIWKDGSIGTMRVLNKLADPELVDAAVEAVKNWRYEPTLLNGQPIEIVTTITVNFRLSSSN